MSYNNITNNEKPIDSNKKIDLSSIDELSVRQLKEVRNDLEKEQNRLMLKKGKPSTLYLITFASTGVIHILNTIIFGNAPANMMSFIPGTISFPNAVSLGILSICFPTTILMHFITNRKNNKIDSKIENVSYELKRVNYKLSEQAKRKRNSYTLKYGNGRNDDIVNNIENDMNKNLEFRR